MVCIHDVAMTLSWNRILTCVLTKLCTSTLMLPIVRTLLTPFVCVENDSQTLVMDAVSGIECFSSYHYFYVICSLIVLIPFVVLCARLVGVDGDLNLVAVHWWTRWKYDLPDLRNMHKCSKNTDSILPERVIFALKLLMLASTMVLTSSSTFSRWLLLFVINLCGVIIVLISFIVPLYYSKATNCARFSSFGSLLFTFMMCVIVNVYDDDGSMTMVHLVMMPVCWCFASTMMTKRINYLRNKASLELLAKNVRNMMMMMMMCRQLHVRW